MSLLEVKELEVSFPHPFNDTWFPVLKEISFSVKEGEVLGIVGESGCGKSVTLRAILGMTKFFGGKVSKGEVQFEGEALLSKSEKEWRKIRGSQITMIPQDPMTSLDPLMKCGKQITEAICLHLKLSKAEAKQKVLELFEEVGIPNPSLRFEQFPHELSGGLRQRVVIAMALSTNPKLILADEPTTALDVTIQKQILELLKKLQKERGMAMVFITHDLGVLCEIADRVAVFYAGCKVEEVPSKNLLLNCLHPYTKGLLGSIPRPYGGEEVKGIEGSVMRPLEFGTGCRFAPRCAFAEEKCFQHYPKWTAVSEEHQVGCFYVEN